jgi:hypothetical protein
MYNWQIVSEMIDEYNSNQPKKKVLKNHVQRCSHILIVIKQAVYGYGREDFIVDQMTAVLTAIIRQPVSRVRRWLDMREAGGDIFVGKGSYVQVSNNFLQDMVESKADESDKVSPQHDE